MKSLILASASPRRKELLRKIAPRFEIVVSGALEIEPPDCHWSAAVRLNAIAKAEAVARLRPDALAIGADTVIELDGKILGKPRDLEDAKAMLRAMSGSAHLVSTGVCLASIEGKVLCQFVESSRVEFKKLSEEEIELYLAKVHVLDKAGAYAIQEHGSLIIKRIEGSFDNVIGLPTERLAEALRAAGAGSLLS